MHLGPSEHECIVFIGFKCTQGVDPADISVVGACVSSPSLVSQEHNKIGKPFRNLQYQTLPQCTFTRT